MFRYDFLRQWVISGLTSLLIIGVVPEVFAHSGHKHEDKPPISLPEVTARVNDADIKRDVILRELKKNHPQLQSQRNDPECRSVENRGEKIDR